MKGITKNVPTHSVSDYVKRPYMTTTNGNSTIRIRVGSVLTSVRGTRCTLRDVTVSPVRRTKT